MEDQISKMISYFNKYRFVILVLSVSAVLRWVLIFRGGQFYFPDEGRYGIAQETIGFLLAGKIKTALFTLTNDFAHLGFKATALIPALMENLFHTTSVFPAIFFSLFSVLNLLLIWKITQKTGGDRAAVYAILLAAFSQDLIYYSRHFLPYDQAMFFSLLALYMAIQEPIKPKQSLLCGAISFLCLITYNGYWALAGFSMAVNLFYGIKEKRWFWKRSAFISLGFFSLFALSLGILLFIGNDVFYKYGVYIQTIKQGAFSEGWSLPFAYLWHAEHGLILVLGLLAVVSLSRLRKQNDKTSRIGLAGFLFIYLCLVVPSNLTHSFVVYGRLARQLMPFMVLAAAGGLGYLASQKFRGQWLINGLIVFLLIQSLWNYRSSYLLVYPREFVRTVQAKYPQFKISQKMMRFYSPLICQDNGFLAVNFHYLYDWSQPNPPVQGEILLRASHPINFLPYQYDGYPPEEREDLRRHNFEMLFYKIDEGYLSSATVGIENCYQEK